MILHGHVVRHEESHERHDGEILYPVDTGFRMTIQSEC